MPYIYALDKPFSFIIIYYLRKLKKASNEIYLYYLLLEGQNPNKILDII